MGVELSVMHLWLVLLFPCLIMQKYSPITRHVGRRMQSSQDVLSSIVEVTLHFPALQLL